MKSALRPGLGDGTTATPLFFDVKWKEREEAMIEGQESQSEKPVIQIPKLLVFLSFATEAACIVLLGDFSTVHTDGVGFRHDNPPWATPTVRIFALAFLAFLQIPILASRKSISKKLLIANGIFICLILLWLLDLYINAPELFDLIFH